MDVPFDWQTIAAIVGTFLTTFITVQWRTRIHVVRQIMDEIDNVVQAGKLTNEIANNVKSEVQALLK